MENTLYSKKPRMILFDVGGTLFDDGKCIPRDGLGELRKYAQNPFVTDDDTLCNLWEEYLNSIGGSFQTEDGVSLEIPLSAMIKYVTMTAGLKFSIDIFSQEEIFDRFNSERKIKDGIPELLSLLKEKGIRTAVISNNAMSGEGLSLAIKRWLPSSEFEFCLTSADILFSKPDSSIFLAALNYAEVDAENCWYCGDGRLPDVEGSGKAGMLPVLIDEKSELPLCFKKADCKKEYMVINHWAELKKFISEM